MLEITIPTCSKGCVAGNSVVAMRQVDPNCGDHSWSYTQILELHCNFTDRNRALCCYVKGVIRRLRVKLEPDPSHPRYIITEPHVGYRFNDHAMVTG
nr:winged helix-turn-helix domain-containing protein [Chloroflexus sp.]